MFGLGSRGMLPPETPAWTHTQARWKNPDEGGDGDPADGEDGMTEGGEVAVRLPTGTVTLLLADLEGSVKLWEADREAMALAVVRLDELISENVANHCGIRPTEQGEGDSFVAAFSRASDSLACALALQLATQDEPWPGGLELRLRMALNTGEARFREGGNYAGTFINRCARLRDTGHGGQILLSRATFDLVADHLPQGATVASLGACRLRDLARPEDVYQLCHPRLQPEFPPLRSLDAMPNNLPVQLTSFIGREIEIAQVRKLLGDNRLVTLTGAGGSGKTRLAFQVAAEVVGEYPDGVWSVDLAPLGDPSFVPAAIASVLGVVESTFQPLSQTIAGLLRAKKLLLLLDNCEHVVSACAEIATALMRGAPSVVIMATSREPLGVEGEVSWRVPSLTLPSPNESSAIESSTQFEAVRLFIDRALRARPNFTVTNENAPAVAEICHRLDGIPLAIELAAARVRLLTPEQIAEGLGDRFRLLTGGARTAMPRQQTLEASVDWSYDHLKADERMLLDRLSVFAGSFSLDAAEAVCSGEDIPQPEVLDVLSRLVDRSLVQVEDAQPAARYRLLETIRQYGRRKLATAGEADTLRNRHLEYYVEWTGEADPTFGSRHAVVATNDRHDQEIENIRAALDWAQETARTDDAMRIGSALVWLWWMRRGAEGKRRLEAIFEMPGGQPLLRASVKTAIAQTCWTVGDPFTGMTVAEEAVAMAREAGDSRLAGHALALLGWHIVLSGQSGASERLEEAIGLLEEDDDYRTVAAAGLGGALFMAGDWQAAREYLERIVGPMVRFKDWGTSTLGSAWLALVAAFQGDFAEAERVIDEALKLLEMEHTPNPTIGFSWSYRGLVLAWRGQPEAALDAFAKAFSVAAEAATPWVEWVGRWFEAFAHYGMGDYATARAAMEQTLPFLRAFNERNLGIGCLALLTETTRIQGDMEAARAYAAELTALVRRIGVGPTAAAGELAAAVVAMVDGDIEAADDAAHGALVTLARGGAKCLVVDALEVLASIAARLESDREAVRLLGAAQAIRDRIDYRFRFAPDLSDAGTVSTREALDADEWEAAWAEGAAMTLEEAVAYAERGRGERKRPSAGWASLTPTELDVARLVAEGLTNKQIAERLFVAPSTIKVHVSHIFGKLGLSTRSELAAQATRRAI
jgi:predicted ATPase/class 3 adenylate cyclase/DNA-binding CsgD family transcriptional regulator